MLDEMQLSSGETNEGLEGIYFDTSRLKATSCHKEDFCYESSLVFFTFIYIYIVFFTLYI